MSSLTGCCPAWATASKCSGGRVIPDLTRSERRSWRLHRQLSSLLTKGSLEEWRPVIERNLQRLRSSVTGQPHSRNLDRWDSLVERGDVLGLHRVLTGLGRDHRRWYLLEVPQLFAGALRGAKAELDPAGIMNPGVLLQPAGAVTYGRDGGR